MSQVAVGSGIQLAPGAKYTLQVWSDDWTSTTVAVTASVLPDEADSFAPVSGLSSVTANAIVRDFVGGVYVKLTGDAGPVLEVVLQQ